VSARERHDDDFAEEGNRREEHSGDAL
jgi:hypothetical protein